MIELSDVLHQFSEWLDTEGLVRGEDEKPDDKRSHDGLVRDFLEYRRENGLENQLTIPAVEVDLAERQTARDLLASKFCLDCGARCYPHPYTHPARFKVAEGVTIGGIVQPDEAV